MATAILEEHTTCAVCFSVFREPYQLRCLHTYCRQCICKLTKYNKVVCPQCRETTQMMDIKKDFKTQNLIEARHEWNNTSDAPKCGMCRKFVKTLDTYCDECDHSMCLSCSDIHKEMKVTKSHEMKPTKDLLPNLKENVKEAMDYLVQEKTNLTKGMNIKIDMSIQEIKKRETDNFNEIDTYICEATESLKIAKASYCHKIKDESKKLVTDMLQTKKRYSLCCQKIQTHIDELCNIIKQGDVVKLKDAQGVVKSDSRALIQEIKAELPSIELEDLTRIEIKKLGKFDPNKMIKVSVVPRVENIRSRNGVYCKIDDNDYRSTTSVKTDRDICRMTMINGDIWCATDEGLYVFNKNCEMTHKIVHRMVTNVTGITKHNLGNIIVGCDCNHGIHVLSLSGDYIGCITPQGHYSDVCYYEGKLYALNYQECKITVFEQRSSTWIKVEDYALRFINGNCDDKLKVHRGNIYVSSMNNSFIQKYSEGGIYIGRFGKMGRSSHGELDSPRISDIDNHGNLLICDSGNCCIQVYDTNEQWHKVRLPGIINPEDIIVEQEGRDIIIWAVCFHKIIKFAKTQR